MEISKTLQPIRNACPPNRIEVWSQKTITADTPMEASQMIRACRIARAKINASLKDYHQTFLDEVMRGHHDGQRAKAEPLAGWLERPPIYIPGET